ncbi:uncharacterized protein TNCV_4002191 [Trichonephila clavipes]|uniref:Uncharacterized protein n=1 Tax=Trichonephila clavipes TaxID=2585209 RepID=A0A8X6RQ13_TRICX|nr:uncharacterized protein TNCV_4002191 [Trichonephila clavipes]
MCRHSCHGSQEPFCNKTMLGLTRQSCHNTVSALLLPFLGLPDPQICLQSSISGIIWDGLTSIWGRGRSLQVPNQMNKRGDQVSQLHSRPGPAVQPRRCVAGHYRGKESRSLAWHTQGERYGFVAVNASEHGVGTLWEEFFENETLNESKNAMSIVFMRDFSNRILVYFGDDGNA